MSGYGWRGPRATMVVLVLVMVMVMVVGVAVGRPQEEQGRRETKNPVFNVWEFAISNNRFNTRRAATSTKDPCTWAIVKCCRAPTRAQRDSCFDDNHCSGAWFDDLCSSHFQGLVRNVVNEAFGGGF